MIERTAKAIYEAGSVVRWKYATPTFQAACRVQARAAIEAMRQPTQAMIDGTGEPGVPDKYYADLWRTMIDEALK